MLRTLPHTDEAILAALKSLAADIAQGCQWLGEHTILTSPMFGGFVRHANTYWFEKEESFEFRPHATTVIGFVDQLRQKATLLTA